VDNHVPCRAVLQALATYREQVEGLLRDTLSMLAPSRAAPGADKVSFSDQQPEPEQSQRQQQQQQTRQLRRQEVRFASMLTPGQCSLASWLRFAARRWSVWHVTSCIHLVHLAERLPPCSFPSVLPASKSNSQS